MSLLPTAMFTEIAIAHILFYTIINNQHHWKNNEYGRITYHQRTPAPRQYNRSFVNCRIFSYVIILLLHLIKQSAENRTTRFWNLSIRNSVKQIQRTNSREKAKGTYMTDTELVTTLEDAYDLALEKAALEAFEGKYEAEGLSQLVQREEIIKKAMNLILERE